MDAGIASEPRPLPAHVAAGTGERRLAGTLDIGGGRTGVKGFDHLRVTQCARGGHAISQPAVQQRVHFPDQAGVEHGISTFPESGVESRCVPV